MASLKKRWASRCLNIGTALLTAGAVAVIAARIHGATTTVPPSSETTRTIPDWESYAAGGVRLGADQPLITIVEFADFQCPFCERAANYLRDLLQDFPDEIQLVYRHYPIHDAATDAALAAHCADQVGLFSSFHDHLYDHRAEIGTRPWVDFASAAGIVDTTGFRHCLQSEEASATLARDTMAARRLGVTGTPTFLVNEREVVGFPGVAAMDSTVLRLLDSLRAERQAPVPAQAAGGGI